MPRGAEMTLPKIEATFEEFPFLGLCCDKNTTTHVSIERWDNEFLEQSSIVYQPPNWGGFGGKTYKYPLYLISRDGELIARVGVYPRPRFNLFNPQTWLPKRLKRETVAQRVTALGDDAKKIYYGVLVWCDRLYIYKPPRNFRNIGDWFNSLVEGERQAIAE